MNRIAPRLATILLAMLAGGTQAGAAPTREADREQARMLGRGRAVALAHCSTCHAVLESGRSRNPLAPPFRELHTAFPVGDLIDAVAQGAPTGHPGMPQFRLSFEQRRDLVAYVRSIQPAPPTPSRPD